MGKQIWLPLLAATWITLAARQAYTMELVRDGKPVATIVVVEPENEKWDRKVGPSDGYAAQVLADWIEKISGARLPIAGAAPKNGPVVFIGQAATDAGLKLGDIKSRSSEGMRISSAGDRLLIAGQNQTATLKATCRLLEELGCRYLMDHTLGEVYPQKRTIAVSNDLKITDQPGFAMRRIWGSVWSGDTLWKVWNGDGGINLGTGHAWGKYIDKERFTDHPEWFALRDGQRRKADWYCTSNEELREAFARGVIEQIEKGNQYPSLSPPDGRGYCECDECRAQDDPSNIEPSSGTVSISNRYADFYQAVAKRVAKKHPRALLSFYCYADYTQAPSSGIELPDNLVAWVAPIRYCRYHQIGDEYCPSRHQLASLVEGWSRSAKQLGYRTYNFNLAEALAPYSKGRIWEHDVPYLHEQGAIGINLETFRNWRINGPHIYQSIRLAYDPGADVQAMMDDYYHHCYGEKAGPIMAEYWRTIEHSIAETHVHAGSYFALHNIYTPARLKQLRSLVDRAEQAAKGDKGDLQRVQMSGGGLRNVEQYIGLRAAMHRGDIGKMKKTYDSLVARTEAATETGLGYHYAPKYLKRFIGRGITAAIEATEGKSKVLSVLPDEWKLEYAAGGDGQERGFHKPGFDDSGWATVRTYSDTLNAQGYEDRMTFMWYRTEFEVPNDAKTLRLFFFENDGLSEVYINGELTGVGEKRREAFLVDASRLQPGKNTVAVRIDHAKMTELDLGGMIRPVYLIGQ